MLPATKASSETALAWSIEQVMVSQTLNGTTKAKILDALFKKCVGIVLPSNLEIRMCLDSLGCSTSGFTRIPRGEFASDQVFQLLVTVGDRIDSWDAADTAGVHSPPALLMARAYGETCVTFLRGKHPDFEAGFRI
mmetsp:Transcript_47054/g.75329  ORF Transcript_47054/g.75329 Transcript_47054/m.75329 type:complete len:136 (-) Transcript_47054:144-551(-)